VKHIRDVDTRRAFELFGLLRDVDSKYAFSSWLLLKSITNNKRLSANLSSMPDTIDHYCLLLFIDHVYDTVMTNAQPISVLALQLFRLGMRKRLLLDP